MTRYKGRKSPTGDHPIDELQRCHAFNANCSPVGYPVQGQFNQQKKLVLVSDAPKRDSGRAGIKCSRTGANSRLVFSEAFGDE